VSSRLLLLSLVSTVTAAPQWGVLPYHAYHGAQPYQLAPAHEPYLQAYALPAQGRFLSTVSVCMFYNNKWTNDYPVCTQEGTMVTTGTDCGTVATAAACTAEGNARFDQLTSDGTKYNIYLNGAAIVTNTKYSIYVLATCTTAVTDAAKLSDVTSPFFMFNGFRAIGYSTDFNIDGTGTGKTAVMGMRIAVTNEAGTLVACTDANMT
jgi:hypothetical protein